MFILGNVILVFNTTLNNNSVAWWWSVLLVEETNENHWHVPIASNWPSFSLSLSKHYLKKFQKNPKTNTKEN